MIVTVSLSTQLIYLLRKVFGGQSRWKRFEDRHWRYRTMEIRRGFPHKPDFTINTRTWSYIFQWWVFAQDRRFEREMDRFLIQLLTIVAPHLLRFMRLFKIYQIGAINYFLEYWDGELIAQSLYFKRKAVYLLFV